MASGSHGRSSRAGRRRRRSSRLTLKTLRRFTRLRWREFRTFLRALWVSPPAIRIAGSTLLLLLLWLTVNWAYQAFYKPSEVLFPLDRTLNKNPSETWKHYGALFREHSTKSITPELLAALAQVEGGGNPVARTYWRWHLTWNPLAWYQPASSAVGMYQITDGTYHDAKRFCIHDHVVVEDGPWHDMRSCWFNSLYARVLPTHAIELTAALLDHRVASVLRSRRSSTVTLQRKQDLAAVIHLCGPGAGRDYAARNFRLTPHQRCGDHIVSTYLAQVNTLKQQFARFLSKG